MSIKEIFSICAFLPQLCIRLRIDGLNLIQKFALMHYSRIFIWQKVLRRDNSISIIDMREKRQDLCAFDLNIYQFRLHLDLDICDFHAQSIDIIFSFNAYKGQRDKPNQGDEKKPFFHSSFKRTCMSLMLFSSLSRISNISFSSSSKTSPTAGT